jgi:CheY-like chemotaxis protein
MLRSVMRDATTAPAAFLIVDDSEADRRLTSYLLEKMGHRAHPVGDARRALEIAKLHACDHALIDMHMPIVDGPELARALRAEPTTSHMRLILFSNSVTPAEVVSALQSGFSGMLRKPSDPAMFVAAIGQLLRERAAQARRYDAADT